MFDSSIENSDLAPKLFLVVCCDYIRSSREPLTNPPPYNLAGSHSGHTHYLFVIFTAMILADTKPRKLLLLDAAGALISAVMLGIVLVEHQALIGLPVHILYYLAAAPLVFLCYDIAAYYLANDYRRALQIIAVANVLYSLVSIALLILHRQDLTAIGYSYFIIEVIIVLLIATYEWKIATNTD